MTPEAAISANKDGLIGTIGFENTIETLPVLEIDSTLGAHITTSTSWPFGRSTGTRELKEQSRYVAELLPGSWIAGSLLLIGLAFTFDVDNQLAAIAGDAAKTTGAVVVEVAETVCVLVLFLFFHSFTLAK